MAKELILSNSKLKTYNRCHNKYRYKYQLGWTPKVKSVPLEVGSWIHALLEAHYKGKDWRKAHKKLTKKFNNYFDEIREQLGEDLPQVCEDIMVRYLYKYPDDLKRFKVIGAEIDETVDLPNGMKLRVIIDLVLEERHTGGIWLWDHKTRKSFQDGEQGQLDPQLTLYHWAAKKLGFGNILGVCINELSTKPPTKPEVLKSGGLSQRANLVCDPYTYMQEVKMRGLDMDRYSSFIASLAVRNGDKFFRRTFMPKDPPMIKTMVREAMQVGELIARAEKKQVFPRNYVARDCRWDCEYKDICITELQGGDPTELVKMFMETRDQRKRREEREKKMKEVKRVSRSED